MILPRKEGHDNRRKSHDISFFLDSEGVLLIDYMSKGQLVTGSYYANLLCQLWQKIKKLVVESYH